MLRFRRFLLLLLIYLGVFFNIERLDFGQRNVIDIDSFVYVLGLTAIIAVLVVPLLARQKLLFVLSLWAMIYSLIKLYLLLAYNRPLIGGLFTYISITELALLLIGIWLAHELAKPLQEFEEVVKNITLADLSHRVRYLADSQDDIQREFLRSRRHQYPMTLVVVEPQADTVKANLHNLIREVQASMMLRYVVSSLGRVIGLYARRTDLVINQPDKGRFIILSPDTQAADIPVMLNRIMRVSAEKLGIGLAYGIASFPDEALTFDDLVQEAEKKLAVNSDPLPVPEALTGVKS